MLDIGRVIDALNDNKPNPNLIIEHWTPYTMSAENTVTMENEWMKQSLSYLRRYLSDRSIAACAEKGEVQ
jgi:hypothetical protein